MKFQKIALRCAAAVSIGLVFNSGFASTPDEQLLCTQAPKSKWISEAKMREIFKAKDYALVKFKISTTHCYEFYAIRKDGGVVEAYYNPENGQLMKYNFVKANGKAIDFNSSLKPSAFPATSAPESAKP
jgi:hypothetical protein